MGQNFSPKVLAASELKFRPLLARRQGAGGHELLIGAHHFRVLGNLLQGVVHFFARDRVCRLAGQALVFLDKLAVGPSLVEGLPQRLQGLVDFPWARKVPGLLPELRHGA